MYNTLRIEEKRIIEHKGTEMPFSGEYINSEEDGTYVCKRCESPLYMSSSKFDAKSGWPSFDEEIEGAVIRKTDLRTNRVEVSCKVCGGHIGHVFTGEKFTEKNTRYCVNSLSLKFIPFS